MVIRAGLVAIALSTLACRGQRETPPGSEPASVSASETTASASVAPIVAEPPPPPTKVDRPLNVLLILIDSLRWDMPWMGYKRQIAPFLTEYQEQVVNYTRAYAISSTTARSVGPLLAGRYPSEMARTGYFFTTWLPENPMLPERLKEAGHARFGVFGHAYFTAGTGVVRGLEPAHVLPGTIMNNPSLKNITSDRFVSATKKFLSDPKIVAQDEGRRFFGYIHFMDPHAPYVSYDDRQSWGDSPRDLYDQEVHYTDEQLGKLIQWIKKQPYANDTALIISADHGESFGEHNHLKHGYELWEELVRVPMLIDVPGAKPRRIETPRSHIDLRRTILDLMHVPEEADTRGVSLVPELLGAEPQPRTVVCDLTRDNLQDRRRAVIDGRYKMLGIGDERRVLMFDIVADPREKKRLDTSHPEYERMKALYDKVGEDIVVKEVRGDEPPLRNAPDGRRW